jgi:hypothetical protein
VEREFAFGTRAEFCTILPNFHPFTSLNEHITQKTERSEIPALNQSQPEIENTCRVYKKQTKNVSLTGHG